MTTQSPLNLYPDDDADFNQWITDLDDIDINQIHNKRQCEVVIVTENSPWDSPKLEVIEKLGEVDDGRLVRCISQKSLYELVEDFGKLCHHSVPKLERIVRCACFEAEHYVKQGNEIPLDLLVKLLKIKIIWLVTQDVLYELGNTEADWCVELSRPAQVSKSKGGEKEGKNKKGKERGKGKGKEEGKEKGKPKQKGKTKKSTKNLTKADPCDQYLQIRDKQASKNVEIEEKTLYIALTGFHRSQIVTLCYENGIFIRSVIKFYKSPRELITSSNSDVLQVKSGGDINSERNVHKTCELRQFWDDIYNMYFEKRCSFLDQSFLMTYSALATPFNESDTAQPTKVLPTKISEEKEDSAAFTSEVLVRVSTFPNKEENRVQPAEVLSTSLEEKNCDKCKEFSPNEYCDQPIEEGEMIYRHFHDAVLKIEDVLRKYEIYLNNLNVRKLGYTPSSRNLDVHSQCFKLPINWNVGAIMHFMLEQLEDEFSAPSLSSRENVEVKKSRAHADVRDQVKRVLKYRSGPGDVEEIQPNQNTNKIRNPRIFHERDDIQQYLSNFEQLPRVLLEKSTSWLARNEHVMRWEERPKLSPEEESIYRRQRREWARCFGIGDRSMCACLYAIVCSTMMSQVATDACHCDEEFSIYPAKDFGQRSFHGPSHCCCNSKLGGNLKRCKLNDVAYIEDVSREVFAQELARELGNYEHVTTKYLPFFDTVVFMLHRGGDDRTGVTKTSWKSKVRTVVKLADFAHFVVHEDGDFIEELETRDRLLAELEEEIKRREYNRDVFEVKPEMFVITGSIKDKFRKQYESLTSQKTVENVGKKRGKNDGRPRDSGKTKKGGEDKNEKETTAGKDKSKTKTKTKGNTKTSVLTKKPIDVLEIIKGDKLDVEVDVKLLIQDPFFHVVPLNAYDFGENMLRAEGTTVTFNSLDKLQVRVEFGEIHQIFRQLTVCICLNDHDLVAHPKSRDGPGFHFGLKNGTLLSFGESPRLRREDKHEFYLLRERFTKRFPCLDYGEAVEEDVIMKSSYLRNLFSENIALGSASRVSFETLRNELETLKRDTSMFDAKFKICSSNLHKYKYVVRVRNPLEMRLNKMVKFLKRFRRENKKLGVKRSIPTTSRCWDKSCYFRCTSPNGLHVQTTPGGAHNSFCVVQSYLVENQNTINEAYRLFLRNGRLAIKRNDGTFMLYTSYGEVVEYKARLKPCRANRKNPSNRSEQLEDVAHWARKRVEKLSRKQEGVCKSKSKKSRSHRTRKRTHVVKPKNDDIQFDVHTSDGKTVKYRNSKISVDSTRFLERRDDHVNRVQVFTKQDGTAISLFENGYCQSRYVDGTRVTSWYEVDCEDVVVDVGTELGEEDVNLGSFTLIHVYYQFEHPNYATVTYGGPRNMFKLVLPQDTALKCGGGGDLELDIDDCTKASVGSDKVVFYSSPCEECRGSCTCTLFASCFCDPNNVDAAARLLEARDTYGKVFSFDRNGRYAVNDVESLKTCRSRLHKKRPSHRFFVADRNLGGKLIWTKDLYEDRLGDVASSRNDDNVVFYVNDKTGEVETVEFKSYESDDYLDKFLSSYSDVPNQKQQAKARAGTANHVVMKHRILEKIKSTDLQSVLETIGDVVKHVEVDNKVEEMLNQFTRDVVEVNEENVEDDDGSEPVKINFEPVRDKIERWKLKCEEARNKIQARSYVNYFKFLESAGESTSDAAEVDEEQVYFPAGTSGECSLSSGGVRSVEETRASERSIKIKASSEKLCQNVMSDILDSLSSQHVVKSQANSSGDSLEISRNNETTSDVSNALSVGAENANTAEDVEVIFHAHDAGLESRKNAEEDVSSGGEEPREESSEILCSCELNSSNSIKFPVEDRGGVPKGNCNENSFS